MLRRHGSPASTARSLRRLYSKSLGSTSKRPAAAMLGGTLVLVSAAVLGAHNLRPLMIHNDAVPSGDLADKTKTLQEASRIPKVEETDGKLRLLAWGSNKSHIISPDSSIDSIRTPVAASFLENSALRDLALHSSHAACVDARGDVYQWGDGFFGPSTSASGTKDRGPTLTLKGKNIKSLQVTESRVYALSASGKLYVLSAQAAAQSLSPGTPTPSSSPWWGTGWMWGEDVSIDFAEVAPAHKLAWGEKQVTLFCSDPKRTFISIAAGRDHLLALTSSGRTFAHPITKNANTYGQLGFRKFDISNPSSAIHPPSSRLHVELTPKAVIDPYRNRSRHVRESSSSSPPAVSAPLLPISENLVGVDDQNIRFCDRLFEIPSLRGVQVDQIAAGGRSSYVKTTTGRVLGWGANEYGQIGLGGNVSLDTITVPTEVVLWRSTAGDTLTKCTDLHAGGDLAFFTVERRDGTSIRNIDLLSCGNGQYGGLGNALFSNAQGAPSRTKSVSGLLEFSEKTNNLQPISPQSMSISPDGHVLLTLDTLSQSGPGGGGLDLFVWGTNYEYQLGNGKRTSIAVPTTLSLPDGNRFMLVKTRAAEVRDARGKVWKKGVEVEQVAVAGQGNSVVYWRICS
ncbi:Chloroperoxidase [Heterobasidion irregulare TC 32-1]|uniref:Chloroperoxidase n=1 Tax=Heterobasidion irregulare (strain TC 32-1) TaxID=747525 RepID=W4KHZ1_HETIT|nr:Chloroperoxidase [Heterobasidion irregulare TC 32-1]ETW85478.1 Chloroperoxidase [Heterobasidion irregulare TC 32-1]